MLPDAPNLRTAVFRALAACLDLPPESPEAAAMLLRAYADPPPPQAPPETNLCFYDLSPDPAAPMLTERDVHRGAHAIFRFMPYSLTLVCYGPDCESNALMIRENLFIDGARRPRAILRSAGIYPVPPAAPPVVLYEEEGARFRKRADLSVALRIRDDREGLPADPLDIPPEVDIRIL